jgi:UDP-N-acetylglucosamine 2-epimerase (non-hydrolysing)
MVGLSSELGVVFPVHPRTRQRIKDFGIDTTKLHLTEPLPYIEFLALQARAAVVITDSGGIQEESTYLGVPCVTMRHNTERPITVECGTNILVADDLAKLRSELSKILAGNAKRGSIPPLWDGRASERIADIIVGAQLHCDASRNT